MEEDLVNESYTCPECEAEFIIRWGSPSSCPCCGDDTRPTGNLDYDDY